MYLYTNTDQKQIDEDVIENSEDKPDCGSNLLKIGLDTKYEELSMVIRESLKGPSFSKELISREKTQDMKVTLENLVDVLLRYFDNLDPSKSKNILVILGNTGCGKSTLLGAMMHGSEELEEKIIT